MHKETACVYIKRPLRKKIDLSKKGRMSGFAIVPLGLRTNLKHKKKKSPPFQNHIKSKRQAESTRADSKD